MKQGYVMKFLQSAGPIILAVLVFIGLTISTKNKDLDYGAIDKRNEIINRRVDSLMLVNKQLDIKLERYQLELDSIKKSITKKDIRIKDLKKAEHEKLLSIDSLSSHELFKLFSEFNP